MGASSLHTPSQNGHAEVVKALITKGANINLQEKNQMSALILLV